MVLRTQKKPRQTSGKNAGKHTLKKLFKTEKKIKKKKYDGRKSKIL